MSRGLLLIILLLSSVYVHAQDTLTFYYNQVYVPKSPDSADIVRKATVKDKLLFVRDYFRGAVLLECGSYYIPDTTREGHFIFYHGNGAKRSEGDYVQNVKVGQWTSWYEDGTLESEQLYLEDANLIYGLIQKDKKIKSLFTAQVSGRILGYNGIRNGRNVWYHENGQKSSEEIYKNGKIVEARFWDDQGKEMKVNIKDDYSNEEHPGIINGDVNTFLAQNIQYPREAWDGGISGRVLIKFKIRKNGLLDDFHVERSSGNEALDNEAMRVVKLMNGRFRPMVSHNRRQETNYMLPVSFKISRN